MSLADTDAELSSVLLILGIWEREASNVSESVKAPPVHTRTNIIVDPFRSLLKTITEPKFDPVLK